MAFVSAVEVLAGEIEPSENNQQSQSVGTPVKQPEAKKELRLPWKTNIPSAAVAYLQSRGISADVIKLSLKQGIVYESKYYNPKSEFHQEKVCVFVGKDKNGKACFATMRGINKEFKRDATGSDKLINFQVPSVTPNCSTVSVFKAPLDALSHLVLEKMAGNNEDIYRLSLGGTAHVALISFLEHHSDIDHVMLCFDSDNAGRNAAENIKKILAEDDKFKHIKTTEHLPSVGKDYNEMLTKKIQLNNKENIRSNRADISI